MPSILYEKYNMAIMKAIDIIIWAVFLYLNLLDKLDVITPMIQDNTIGIIGDNKSIMKLVKK